jgi:nitroreductase
MKKEKVMRILSVAMASVLAMSVSATVLAEESEEKADILYERTTLHDSYDSTPLEDEVLNQLLNAGFSAPTGGNQRSIEFFPVTDREMLDAMAEVPGFFGGLETAPLAVVICGNEDIANFPELEQMDSGIAAMAMIVQATDLGLSSCVMSISPQEERIGGVSEILGLTENFVPVLLVAFGYPEADATTSASVDNYNETQVHINGLENSSEPVEETEVELADRDVYTATAHGNVYTATAQGISSSVIVTILVNDGAVVDCTIDASGETPEIGGEAAEELQQQIVENGSLTVDAVSGATVTSSAVQTALADIAVQAGLE